MPHLGFTVPQGLGAGRRTWGADGGGWRGGGPGVLVWALLAAPVLTAGQGPLPELLAPGPDQGPGGDGWGGGGGGGPRRGQADRLAQGLSHPSLSGTPPLLPTELSSG